MVLKRGPGNPLWQKGVSGNPAGKAPGTRHKTSIWAEGVMQEGAEEVFSILMQKAKEGDMAAIKMVADRIAPIRKAAPFAMPEHLDKAEMLKIVMAAVADGDLTPGEALDVSKLATILSRSVEKPAECDAAMTRPKVTP